MVPAPMKSPDRTCATQLVDKGDVHANQKRPIGRTKAPTIIGGSRSSGLIRLPFAAKRRCHHGLKQSLMRIMPTHKPVTMARKGSVANERRQCRIVLKEKGKAKNVR